MTNRNIHLAPPWWQLERELKALFEGDPYVTVGDLVEQSESEKSILIQCSLYDQTVAYKEMLNKEYAFGNITVKITVLGPDEDKEVNEGMTDLELMDLMFRYNPRYVGNIVRQDNVRAISYEYCVFTKELIQFYNDDLSSYVLYTTELASNVVQKVVRKTSVMCCTYVDGVSENIELKKTDVS